MAKKKRRKLTRAQARKQALRKKRQRRMTWALVGVAAVAVIVVLVLIAMSGEEATELVEVESLRDDVETGVTEEGYPYRGSADAPVTIVELSDYNCPICGDFALNTFPLIDDELVATGQVKYVIQPFALWEGSLSVVEAAACARDQGGFWGFHHRLFANRALFSTQRPPSRSMLRQMAEASGLDVDEFETCLDEGRTQEQVLAATQNGKVELGVNGTPTFFVNGEKTQLARGEAYIDTIRQAVRTAQTAGSSE